MNALAYAGLALVIVGLVLVSTILVLRDRSGSPAGVTEGGDDPDRAPADEIPDWVVEVFLAGLRTGGAAGAIDVLVAAGNSADAAHPFAARFALNMVDAYKADPLMIDNARDIARHAMNCSQGAACAAVGTSTVRVAPSARGDES